VLVVDSDDVVTHFNRTMEQMTGISQNQALGCKLMDAMSQSLWGEGVDLQNLILQVKENGEKKELTMSSEIERLNEQRFFWVTIIPLFEASGNYDGILFTTEDISARTTAEQKVKTLMEDLERRVEERTEAFSTANQQLEMEIAERTLSEQQLRESEEKFRTISEQSLVGILIFTRKQILYANSRYAEMSGYSIQELLALPPMGILTLTHPDDQEIIISNMREKEHAGKNSTSHYIARGIAKSGEIVWGELYSKSIVYEGQPAILAMLVDISDRIQADEARRESEEQYRRLFENAFDIIAILSTKGEVLSISPSVETILGYAPEEVIGKLFWAKPFTDPETMQKAAENVQLLLEGSLKTPVEYIFKNKGGLPVILDTFATPIFKEGKITTFSCIARDVTERTHAEEQLQQMNQFLDSIIDNIPHVVVVTDAKTLKCVRGNAKLEEFFGLTQTEFLGKTVYDLFPQDFAHRLADEDQKLLQTRQTVEMPDYKAKDGRFYRLKKIPLFDYANNVEFILTIGEDITEQIEAEKARQTLLEKTIQVSELKSNLITMAAHELKTPLTSIFGWADLLFAAKKQGKSLDATFDLEDLESILRNADRLNDLINDFLDVGRVESGQLEINRQHVDFYEIVSDALEAVEYLATQKGITIIREAGPSVNLSVDRRRIAQVVINLLTNAIKYSPPNTRVSIVTSITDLNGQAMFRLQVIDEGYGFTPEELADAMQPFGKAYTQQDQKRAVQGTGLGLFISRRIVEQHGGTIKLSSEGVNQGTEVEILLPLDEES